MARLSKREREQERAHARFRSLETEVRNALGNVNRLVMGMEAALKARDCKTARINFDQAMIDFKPIARKLAKVSELHRRLRLAPALAHETHPTPAHIEPPSPASTRPPARAAAKPRAHHQAKRK